MKLYADIHEYPEPAQKHFFALLIFMNIQIHINIHEYYNVKFMNICEFPRQHFIFVRGAPQKPEPLLHAAALLAAHMQRRLGRLRPLAIS